MTHDIHVAPKGNDSAAGTQTAPFATLARARDAVRELLHCSSAAARRSSTSRSDVATVRTIRVRISGGIYRLKEPVVFGPEDSAPEGCTVTYEAITNNDVDTTDRHSVGHPSAGGAYRPVPGSASQTHPAGHPTGRGAGGGPAYNNAAPTFTSGIPVTGWRKLDDLPPGAPEAARGNIWVARLPRHAAHCKTLYDSRGMLPRATEPGFFPDQERVAQDNFTLYFPPGAMQDDPAIADGDVEISVIPEHPWVMNLLPLASVDTETNTARTAIPATYRMSWSGTHSLFQEMGMSAVEVQNTFAGLREPGSWVARSRERRLYLWPRKPGKPRGIKAPCLTELIRIEGTIEPPTVGRATGPSHEAELPVRGLEFKGLTFTHTDRFAWEANRTGYTLQHEWEMFDRPTASVRLRGAQNCAFEHCRFINSGGTGIRMDLHAQRNRVERCEFAQLGGCGVVMAGYGPGTKDVNHHNRVTGNHIHHVGTLLWHSVAVFAWQSGHNRITRNLIHDTPYSAILVTGRINWTRSGKGECSRTVRWHEIDADTGAAARKSPTNDTAFGDHEMDATACTWATREKYLHGRCCLVADNEIYDCMDKLGDGNAIYISGAGRDNIVRGNYIHDIMAPKINAVIRCDDDQHDVTIEGNLIENCCAEGFIWKGRTIIRNNVIIGLRGNLPNGGFCTSKRGHWVIPYCNEPDGEVGSVIEHNLFLCHDPDMRMLHDGGDMGRFFPGYVHRCGARSNLYWNTDAPDWGKAYLSEQQARGSEQGSLVADPLLHCEGGNVTFAAGTPAIALGIQPLHLSRTANADQTDGSDRTHPSDPQLETTRA